MNLQQRIREAEDKDFKITEEEAIKLFGSRELFFGSILYCGKHQRINNLLLKIKQRLETCLK